MIVVAERLSKKLLTLGLFMEPIATLERRKTHTKMKQKKFSTAFTVKDPIENVKAYNNVVELPPSHSEPGSYKQPCENHGHATRTSSQSAKEQRR